MIEKILLLRARINFRGVFRNPQTVENALPKYMPERACLSNCNWGESPITYS